MVIHGSEKKLSNKDAGVCTNLIERALESGSGSISGG